MFLKNGKVAMMYNLHINSPDTAVTLWFIKKLVNTGELPCVTSGNQKLICLDIFELWRKGELYAK